MHALAYLVTPLLFQKMPPQVVWDQAHYLYDEKWTPEVDNMFINLLVDHAIAGQFWVGANNSHSIEVIQWIICTHFQKDFTLLDCNRHVKKVQKRHCVFDWPVHLAGVLYDVSTNTLIGAPFIWDHICMEQPFAYAYMTHGDPK
ncbi:hypothetical protein BUALT_Bualt02G0026300 [Buddleja alternifolia]|uniref:Uncharacterized protein n=1 Tax=Buddleja alternifolia TaxID=168488 RepID=A0AAV6Y4W8_9LAMI|nr:hypothetical protein BUALT_Bualt02G0026300 [Buddleja alternifolia]